MIAAFSTARSKNAACNAHIAADGGCGFHDTGMTPERNIRRVTNVAANTATGRTNSLIPARIASASAESGLRRRLSSHRPCALMRIKDRGNKSPQARC